MSEQRGWADEPLFSLDDVVVIDGEPAGTLSEFLNYATIMNPDAWKDMFPLIPDEEPAP